MELIQIQNLFNQISAIIKQYDKIAEITGEKFNIFRVLKLETSEVRMHSAFLSELLNPRGSHGQKDVFLKLFIKYFELPDFKTTDAIVQVEKFISRIDSEFLEGGFIDILITSKSKERIIIENKIYAQDQKNQLARYSQFDSKAHMFYLTLYGREPDVVGFKAISYQKDIVNWLEECRKESVGHALLRETITQYINLIKYLTNQTIIVDMQEEIEKIIL